LLAFFDRFPSLTASDQRRMKVCGGIGNAVLRPDGPIFLAGNSPRANN
jgi:hypothetical protein